ncbi:RNA-directed RNA polymerase (Sad-1) [Beauveria brongniartii RCEF 3172]|uniref:RNA-dependent RNA polymerase n=1 Tax=Beauveria brongniartii RCEF 3172 TaxID=1081107 RepID=A0A162HUA3_9HYPO|nr:RNA-directed RNA polymerase (Sad-1) [Beauveria brongniartii RCEF 3172]
MYPEQIAEKWSGTGLSGNQSRSPSRNPSNSTKEAPKMDTISLRLRNLPEGITMPQLWNSFSPKGSIRLIEIYDSRQGEKGAVARIDFAPPPELAFWKRRILSLALDGHEEPATVHVDVLSRARREPPQSSHEQRCPSIISMQLKSLDFGSLLKKDTMVISASIQSPKDGEISLEFNPVRGEVIIYFHFQERQKNLSRKRLYKLITHVTSITNLQTVQILYRLIRGDGIATTIGRGKLGKCIDISRSKTFRCIIDETDSQSLTAVESLMLALEQYDIVPTRTTLKLEKDHRCMWDLLDHPSDDSSSNTLEYLSLTAHHIYLDFAVRYRLEVCVTRGYLREHAIETVFLEKLAALDVSKASQMLEYLVDEEIQLEDPLQLFEDAQYRSAPTKRKIPYYCSLVLKANITPTSLKLNLPNVESSNRVMRKYNNLHDRFLRVQFLSETESNRIAKDRYNNDDVWKRLLRALHKGIRIGDRTYEFLAFGNSQLREGSVTFFCPTAHVSCADIRKWLGNFDHIRNVAKFGARIGQCFSTTREVRGVRVPTIRHIDDIEAKGECFTDGVGVISGLLAQLVVDELELDIVGNPSAFQFRMGGAKGVLAVWPREYAKHMEVCLRKSQVKFSTEANTLEIIKCAKTSTATLNRQIITILEHLGVPPRAFMALLNKQIQRYEEAMTSRTAAIDLLTKFVDENQTTVIVAELLKADFQDPFVKNLLKLWRSWSLKLLKEKCRIQVEQSAFVMGCIDETGTLRGHSIQTEGSQGKDKAGLPHIFLQMSDRKYGNKTTILQGVCFIGRNPSLHAGDIRVVEAVDTPCLRHLKDVVVFPSKGDRSLPSMLSGGDLDGDEYFVIWDPTLVPKIWNTPPMHCTPVTSQDLERDVEVDDLRNFAVKYMKNDCLGLIAVAHLAHADGLGLNHPTCLQLAKLHSQAVDYLKTGVPAEWNKARYQPRKWPHFMQRNSSTYPSHKALGKLYNRVAEENFDYIPSCEDEFDSRITLRFNFTDEILASARNLKQQYDVVVRRLLKQFRVATEFELYSGWAMSKPAVGSDYKRQEDLRQQFDTLKQRFREMCLQEAGIAGGSKLEELVAAIYKVTEDEAKDFLAEAEAKGEDLEFSPKAMPLISFPWIFHWVLIKIAMGHSYQPSKTSLAAATRPTPMAAAAPPQQEDYASQVIDAPNIREPRRSIEVPKEAVKVDGEADLMDFDAVRTEPGKTSCNTPEESTEYTPSRMNGMKSKVNQLLRLYEDSDEN